MLDLTPEQFTKKVAENSIKIKKLIEKELPITIGKEAVEHFKLNFQNQGWERQGWPEVKRRQATWDRGDKSVNNPMFSRNRHGELLKKQKAGTRRPILTGETGDLGRSIHPNPQNGVVTITADAKSEKGFGYAAVHNDGLKAGRGKGFIMPKRQFIGESETLNKKITDIIEDKITIILSK